MRLARVPQNRRRHPRFPLGLPVTLYIAGRTHPITVEVVDLSAGGVRLRVLEGTLRVGERASLHFVLPGRHACTADGRISRAERRGELVLGIEKANDAFRAFLASLSDGAG